MVDRAERMQVKIVSALKDLRRQRKISHDVLAHRAGVTRSAISHIESGRRNPSLSTCLRLAQGLEVDLSEILRAIEAGCPKSHDCRTCEYARHCP